MKRFFLSFLAFLPILALGQLQTVMFDYEKSAFDGGSPLPAQESFFITGAVASDMQLVEVETYRQGSDKLLYTTGWRRPFSSTADLFQIPYKYKLASNNDYDFQINYYRYVSREELEALKMVIHNTLDAYIGAVVKRDKKDLDLEHSPNRMIKEMNSIVIDGMQYYRTSNLIEFQGFSDIVKFKIEEIRDIKLKKAKFIFGSKEDGKKLERRSKLAQNLIQELKVLVHTESAQFLNGDLLIRVDSKRINDYPTKKTLNFLSINVGYGGVYLAGDLDNLSYGTAPYVGLSVPLAGARSDAMFWRNASISAGVFLQDFENANGEEVTGAFINQPYYLGLGYRLFRFVRLNAGATLLENPGGDLQVAPFVGVSAELNFWLGIGK